MGDIAYGAALLVCGIGMGWSLCWQRYSDDVEMLARAKAGLRKIRDQSRFVTSDMYITYNAEWTISGHDYFIEGRRAEDRSKTPAPKDHAHD